MKLKGNSIVNFVAPVFFVTGLFAVTASGVAARERQEKQDANLAKQAKITLAQARATARKKAPGKIEGEELEREHGKLIYSFDIRNSKGTITEVQVDAKTGRLVSVEEESKQEEANEKRRDEKQEKRKGKKN